MKKISILFLILLVSISTFSAETTREITELYVNANGNNKFEARIKANAQGMSRAFYIITDKMKLSKSDIDEISYSDLKNAFSISEVKKESATDASYSAMVSYRYDLYSINRLLEIYGNKTIQDKFYEYLVIPIMKQKNIITLWEENTEWNTKWGKSRTLLNYYRLYYPNSTPPIKKLINTHNIFNMTYDSFLDIFSSLLFKKALLIVSEYFTDPVSGNVVMNVKNIILEHGNKKSISEVNYPLEDFKNLPKIVDIAVNDVLKNYGSLRPDAPKSIRDRKHGADDENTRTLMLNVEAFNDDELHNIEKKLENVPDIKKFEVRHDYGHKYKIMIWTDSDDYSLTEGFYLNGLSFKIYGNLYNLIDIKEGV